MYWLTTLVTLERTVFEHTLKVLVVKRFMWLVMVVLDKPLILNSPVKSLKSRIILGSSWSEVQSKSRIILENSGAGRILSSQIRRGANLVHLKGVNLILFSQFLANFLCYTFLMTKKILGIFIKKLKWASHCP